MILPLLAFTVVLAGLFLHMPQIHINSIFVTYKLPIQTNHYQYAGEYLRNERYSVLGHTSRRTLTAAHDNSSSTNGTLTKVLQVYGGPLCKNHIGPWLAHTCPKRVCGEFNLWFDDIYRDVRPAEDSSVYRSSHYFTSPFVARNVSRRKVVISVGHNGLGFEFYQHYFAQGIAEHIHGYMFASSWHDLNGEETSPDRREEVKPMNPALEWSRLPLNHPAREICSRGNMTYSMRPVDMRIRAKAKLNQQFDSELIDFLLPTGSTDCLITSGFFFDKDTCADGAKKMWPIFSNGDLLRNYSAPSVQLGPRDMVIPFSCQPGSVLDETAVSIILNNTKSSWDRIIAFHPKVCPSASSHHHVMTSLESSYGTLVTKVQFENDHDFVAQLVRAHLLIEDKTGLSYWTTVLSNATRKHSVVSLHGSARSDPSYVYHELRNVLKEKKGGSNGLDENIINASAAQLKEGADSELLLPAIEVPQYDKARLAQLLHDNGGPLCRENLWLSLHSRCATPNVCGEYDLWYNDVYRGITPDVNSSSYRDSHYFQSPFTGAKHRKIVVSIGHNGLGNQFFQHYFAQRVAEQVHGLMYMLPMEGKNLPPNTAQGANWNHMVSDPALLWEMLPPDHPARAICLHHNITYARRPIDVRMQSAHDKNKVLAGLSSFLDPQGSVRCLVTLGYFQEKGQCRHTVQRMWPLLSDNSSFVFKPRIALGPRDLVIHFRCEEKHYGVPDKTVLENILNGTIWDRVIMVMPPGCHGAKYKDLIAWVKDSYPEVMSSTSKDVTGFDDFILLVTAHLLVEDRSTYSYWAGIFSNATEKHVDKGFHGVSPFDNAYFYHDPKSKMYFMKNFNGKLIPQTNRIGKVFVYSGNQQKQKQVNEPVV